MDKKNGKGNNKFQNMLDGFIPKRVSNKVFVNVYDMLRGFQRLGSKKYELHTEDNRKSFRHHSVDIARTNGYIEDQNKYTDMRYGKVTMKFSGCEIFATYNALKNLHGKSPIELSDMIKEYEKDGMVLSGKFGTAPKAIKDYLDRHGYRTTFTTKETDYDAFGENNETLILTMYNDRRSIMRAVHTVSITKDKGQYTAHNVYCNGKVVGPYASVTELVNNINHGNAKGISIIGVNKN